MDRLMFSIGILFLCFFSVSSSASIIVTNDWASATVLVRDQKGGQISKLAFAGGAVGLNIEVNGEGRGYFDVAYAEINQDVSPGYMIKARVSTEDNYTEVEGWLHTSWGFTVSDAPVDYTIGLSVFAGGDIFSSFSFYDLTDNSFVSSRRLSSFGQIVDSGTLAVGHDYIFNACLFRTDMNDLEDRVYDGTSDLVFLANTGVLFSSDRTHTRIDLPGPGPLFNFIFGLAALAFVRKVKTRQ